MILRFQEMKDQPYATLMCLESALLLLPIHSCFCCSETKDQTVTAQTDDHSQHNPSDFVN